ncbi:MAG: transporter substrate-binding domain-containing protein [Defluviitaleaceae bacterium]|nr:transporter substrate-binding domain-containing protein [Defluviitaleaceae bacterium]
MKKVLLLVAALSLVLIFGACNDTAEVHVPAADSGISDDAGTTNANVTPDANVEGEIVYQIFSDNAFPPFHMLNPNTGEFYGFDVDLIEAIAADQGFRIERNHVGFAAALGALEAGIADGMIAGMSITEERRERFDFSEGYFVAGQILVVPRGSSISGFADLAGQTVAVKIGTVGSIFGEAMAEEYGFNLIFFEDSPTMYASVMLGSAAAAIEDRPVIEFEIYRSDLALQTVGETLNPRYYGFAVRRGEFPELIEMFNTGLANLRANGYYYEILARYGLALN